MEERAVEVETNRALSKRPRQGQPATGNQPSRYQLECVLEEAKAAGKAKVWYTVRWEGYHPFWEAWRISEEVGSPLETWEPQSHVMGTEAWEHWEAAKQAEARAAAAEEAAAEEAAAEEAAAEEAAAEEAAAEEAAAVAAQ